MAIRIDKAIIRGEISNEIRGLVTGLIWIVGKSEPLRLRLSGNCLRDLAGCSMKFENPEPAPESIAYGVSLEQNGKVGDMTASRRVKLPTVTEDELHELLRRRCEVPSVTANTLYLEWFSEENGRVVIETAHCAVDVSEPEWSMTEDDERAQEAESQRNFYDFLDQITGSETSHPSDMPLEDGFLSSGKEAGDEEDEPFFEFGHSDEVDDEFHELAEEGDLDFPFEANLQPLDEFEWERELREADRKAAAYQEALEKYRDCSDRDRLVAEAMGWDDSDETDLGFDWEQLESGDGDSSGEPGVQESRDDEMDMELHHPLSRRVTDLALQLQDDAQRRGLIVKHDPSVPSTQNPYLSVVMHIIALGGKLASALDGTVHGIDPEPGFVIAMLKRAQIPLNEALHAIGALPSSHLDANTAEWLDYAREELFELRNEILEIMKELRLRNS